MLHCYHQNLPIQNILQCLRLYLPFAILQINSKLRPNDVQMTLNYEIFNNRKPIDRLCFSFNQAKIPAIALLNHLNIIFQHKYLIGQA